MNIRDFRKRLYQKRIKVERSDQPDSAVFIEQRFDELTGEEMEPRRSNVQLRHIEDEIERIAKKRDDDIERITAAATTDIDELTAALKLGKKVAWKAKPEKNGK